MSPARCLLPLVLVAQIAWIGSAAQADQEQEKDTPPVVESIAWTGNDALSRRALRDHILTQATRWPRFWVTYPLYEDELREDMERIVALYKQSGYYEAAAEYSLEFDDERSRVAITIRIHEGEPVRVRNVQIRLPNGLDPATHPNIDARPWAQFLANVPMRRGKIFELEDYRGTRQSALKWVAGRGYPRAQLKGSADIDLKSHEADVEWTLVLGPRVRLGEVEIKGLEDVDEYIVRREIRFEPDQWYSPSEIAKARRRIQNLSLFRWTIVEATPPEQPEQKDAPEDEAVPAADVPDEVTWPVSIRLAERPPRRVRIGGGWGTDTSFRAELSWQHRNFWGGARNMDVSVRYSGLGAALRPTFMEPYFLGTRTRLLVSPAVLYETQDAYSARRILLDVQLQRVLVEPWSARVGYQFDRSDVYSVVDDPGEDELPEGISITTGPVLGLRRSTVNSLTNARSGTLLDLTADSSLTTLGSDEDYIRYTVDARAYLEIWKTVLAGRVLFGTIHDLFDTRPQDIPLVERFYSGGSTSMRGFGYRSLSPEDENGDSIGGSSVVEAAIELRIPIWRNLGAVAFVDAAQVDPEPFTWPVDDLRYAAGPGLRYDTPAGPIRLDFAWRLNPERKRGKFRISASLGHTF